MDHFKDRTSIKLYPGSSNLAYDFKITKESAAGENDGFLRYNEVLTSIEYTVTDNSTGIDVTDIIVSDSYLSDDLGGYYIIKLSLNYNTTLNTGRYNIKFLLTLTSDVGTSVRPCNYYKLEVVEE